MVTVSPRRPGRSKPARVRITVADTGPGMTREELDRAFDDFYTTKAGGTGLGSLDRAPAGLDLSGALRVETEPGAGTRVILELPAVRASGAQTAP